jgi:hypothetical protein
VCNLCGGTHRVAYEGAIGLHVQACPNCGPVPEHIHQTKKETFWKCWNEAKKQIDAEEKWDGDAA